MKKILALSLSLTLLAGITAGCGKKDKEQKIQVWHTYSTEKVLMDSSLNGNYENLGEKLNVKLAKGEYEMSQLVITTKNAVSSYDVKLSDLKMGDEVYKKENIKVYHQRPINVVSKTTGNHNEKFPKGLMPDCLLPLEVAQNYGENKINAGSNQPVSFEFFTPINQKPGTYKGNFEVVVDKESFNIPVTMTVWNYVMPQSTYGKSCMLIYQSELFYGEMDSSDEMYTAYYEELLKNKMNAWHVPYTATSPEKMVESVIKYWDEPNFNSFGMPDLIAGDEVNYEAQRQYLLALGKASTPERILFDKAYFYHTVIDEPHAFPEKHKKVTTIISNVNKLLADVFAQLNADGVFEGNEEFKNAVEKSITNMPQIVTSPYSKDYDGSNVTYCPPIQFVNKEEDRKNLQEEAERENVSTWTYTCNNPVFPYPSTHIDDYLLGSRTMKWMQKAYNIEGYLAWAVNQYSKVIPFDPLHRREEINPYTDPQRVLGPGDIANGDGYLFYPGKKYESKKPFTSIRLKSLRDGQDDYDALCLLQNMYEEFDKFYGTNGAINSDSVLRETYDKLFAGTIYNTDSKVFDKARDLVANLIENASLNEKFVCNSNITGSNLNLTIYVNKGYNVKVGNGILKATSQGEGNKFETSIPLDKFDGEVEITVSKDNYSKVYIYKGEKVAVATNFAENKGKDKFTVNGESLINLSDGKANITVKSKDFGSDSKNLKFKTGFTIKANAFDVDFTKLSKVYFNITNNSESDLRFKVYIVVDGSRNEFSQVFIKKGETITLKLNRICDASINGLNNAEGLFFAFENAYRVGGEDGSIGNVVLYDERKLSIGDVFYVTEK